MLDYMTVKEAAQKWGVTPRQVQLYCQQGILDGAFKLGHNWIIPTACTKPVYRFVSERIADEPGKTGPADENP